MIRCLFVSLLFVAGCSHLESNENVQGIYSVEMNRVGGNCAEGAGMTTNETISIVQESDGLALRMGNIRGTCPVQREDDKLVLDCGIVNKDRFRTVKGTWNFDSNQFTGETTISSNCSLVYNVKGVRQ